MMLRHIVLSLFAAFGLAGCVLQSQTPNFNDAMATPLPKALGTRFSSETFTDNAWKREDGIITMTADGKRYVISNDTGTAKVDAIFVRLGATSWVMQAREKDKPTAYVLAELEDNNLNLKPLFCEELQKQATAEESVRFEGTECFLKDVAGLDVFRGYAKQFGPAKARLVPVK